MTDEERRILERAGVLYPEHREQKNPDNIFVFEVGAFLSQNQLEQIHEELLESIKQGIVVLAPYIKLKAVTGPCTDVEVKIISPEEVR